MEKISPMVFPAFSMLNEPALLSVTRVRCTRPRGVDIPSDQRQGALLSGTPFARSVSVFGPMEGTLQADRGMPTSGSLPCHLYEASVNPALYFSVAATVYLRFSEDAAAEHL